MASLFEDMGVAIDAWTGYDEIAMEATCLREELPVVLRILCARLQSFSFTGPDLTRERAAILKEIASADAEVIATRGLFAAAFPQSGYRRDCAGGLGSVLQLGAEDVDWFYTTRIQTAPLAFVVTGPEDSFDSAVSVLTEEFKDLQTAGVERNQVSQPRLEKFLPSPSTREQPRTRIKWGKPGRSMLAIGLRGPGIESPRAADFFNLARALTTGTDENCRETEQKSLFPRLIKSSFGIENATVHSCILRNASMLVISLRVRDGKSLQALAAAVKALREALAESGEMRPLAVEEPLRLRVLRSLWSTRPDYENALRGRRKRLSEDAVTVSAVLSPADAPFAGSLVPAVVGALGKFDSEGEHHVANGRSIGLG